MRWDVLRFLLFMLIIQSSTLAKKMAASKILILLLLNPFLRCFSIENKTNTFGIAGNSLFQKHTASAKFPVLRNDKNVCFYYV